MVSTSLTSGIRTGDSVCYGRVDKQSLEYGQTIVGVRTKLQGAGMDNDP